MIKPDLKDRKILYELELDSRQSFRAIGRKVGLSKDVVASRVKKLQEKGIIKFFRTEIDINKLGNTYLRFYYKYQTITPEIKKEIIDCYTNYKHVRTVSSNHGSNDLCVNIEIIFHQKYFQLLHYQNNIKLHFYLTIIKLKQLIGLNTILVAVVKE
jgi:DNA-binding Lrp family transcriptional regulator